MNKSIPTRFIRLNDSDQGVPMRYPIDPVPKPRMTQRDAWKKRPVVVRYHAFKDLVAAHQISLRAVVRVVFHVAMPKSWSKAKKAAHDGQPHQQKPDIDNFLKALLDSVFEDDAHVWKVNCEKRWAYEGAIEIVSRSEA